MLSGQSLCDWFIFAASICFGLAVILVQEKRSLLAYTASIAGTVILARAMVVLWMHISTVPQVEHPLAGVVVWSVSVCALEWMVVTIVLALLSRFLPSRQCC